MTKRLGLETMTENQGFQQSTMGVVWGEVPHCQRGGGRGWGGGGGSWGALGGERACLFLYDARVTTHTISVQG